MSGLALYLLNQHGEPEPFTGPPGDWCVRWPGQRHVAVTGFINCHVSTIFHGINLNPFGPPLLWETAVIGGLHNGHVRRHASKAEALKEHAALVARIMAEGDVEGEADDDAG